MYHTYLLKLSNNDIYTGSTGSLKTRLERHRTGAVPHTAKFRPVKLIWFSGFISREKAVRFEKYLKSSSGKAFRNKHLI